jgi:hypothetical protein
MTAIKSLDTNTYTLVIDAVLNTIATRTRLTRRYMLLDCIYDFPRHYDCRIHDTTTAVFTAYALIFIEFNAFDTFIVTIKFTKKLQFAYQLKIIVVSSHAILIKSQIFEYFPEIFLRFKILLKPDRNIWHFAHNPARDYVPVSEAKIIFLFQIRRRSCITGNSRTFWKIRQKKICSPIRYHINHKKTKQCILWMHFSLHYRANKSNLFTATFSTYIYVVFLVL